MLRDLDLHVLYEDDHLVAVDKPACVVTHPTYKHPSGTLLDALRAYAADWPASRNPTIVTRLDKLTSGIVIAATHAQAHATLQRTAMTKEYLAIVDGEVDETSGAIDLPLGIDPDDRRRVVVSSEGKRSVTDFETIEHRGGLSLLRCRLITGRRHQIRVHLASRGWPIVGDAVYGRARDGFDRHALHAWRVAFVHPFTAEPVQIEAPVPTSLRALITSVAQ
jgi:23S rRNA pseudouridine1911/1915/1917 synthase